MIFVVFIKTHNVLLLNARNGAGFEIIAPMETTSKA